MKQLMPEMRHGDSWLFCTPPPEDVQARLNGCSEEGRCTMILANEPHMQNEYLEERRTVVLSTHQQEQSSNPCFNRTASADTPTTSKRSSLQPEHKEQAIAKSRSSMAPRGASLTSSAKTAAEASAPARSHPSSLTARKPHLATSRPVTLQSTSTPYPSRGTEQRTTLLGQLAGYSSSEEDDIVQGSGTPGKPNKPQPGDSASRHEVPHPRAGVDSLSPSQKSHDTPARKGGTSGQRSSTTMVSETDRTRKRQVMSPIPAARKKQRKRGPFNLESSDDDSGIDDDSFEEEDDLSCPQSGNNNRYLKMTQAAPTTRRRPFPNEPPPVTKRPVTKRLDVRDMRRRMLAMQGGNVQDNAPKPSAPFASNTQATSKANAKAVRREEDCSLSQNGPMQKPKTTALMRAVSMAPLPAASRPSKFTPATALGSEHAVSTALEPSASRPQPTTKTQPNGTGTSRPPNARVVNHRQGTDSAQAANVRRSAPPRQQANVVSGLLGDIRQNGQKYDSSVKQKTSTPAAIQNPSSQKTPVHKELHIPASITATHALNELKNETRLESKPERADVYQQRPRSTSGGRGLPNSVGLNRAPRHNTAAPPNLPQLPTPKRKIDDVSTEPGQIKPFPKRPAVSATHPPHTPRSEGQVSVRQKSTTEQDTCPIAMPKPTLSGTRLEATSGVMKPTTAPKVTSSFIPSRQSSVSAAPARRSTPAAEAMASQNLKQQAKSRKTSEVAKAVSESAKATDNKLPPSKKNSAATDVFVSGGEAQPSPIITRPSRPEDDHRVMESRTNAPCPKERSDVPDSTKTSNRSVSSSQAPSVTPLVKGPKTSSVAINPSPIMDKERKATPGLTGPGKPQQGVAPNKSLEASKEELGKEGRALSDGAETPSKSQGATDSSMARQKATSQPPVQSVAVTSSASGPRPSNSKTSDPGSLVHLQHLDHPKTPAVSEPSKTTEPKVVHDPKPIANLLPAKKQATKGKEPAATPAIPKVLSVPSREAGATPGIASTIDLSTVAALPRDAEPFFEYSVLQRVSDSLGNASSDDDLVLSSSCTNIEEANAQAKRVFDNIREQYQQYFAIHFSEATSKRDDDGCVELVGTFAPVDHPNNKNYLKVWVRRATVSQYAGQAPKDVKYTSFISKTVYVLRLFRLLSEPGNSEGDDAAAAHVRVHHPHSRTECYTTLNGANRAAKSLQIELSHKSNPAQMEVVWQAKSLAELNQKAMDLETASDGEEKYWKSEFNGRGLGSDKFELLVEKVGLCGPRNL